MKNKIKYLIIILLIVAILLIFYINKQKKDNSTYGTEFKNYKEEYVAPKTKYECNEFSIINMSTHELLQIYFNNYKNAVLEEPEKAYNLLEKEYREKRFGSIEAYKLYIENNKEKITISAIDSYQVKQDGDNNRYICIDTEGNYYIFNETAVMDYTVILDTYTIDLPEFTEKYNTATEQQKVALNIDKFMQAINDKNYRYAYSCLADSYKNNNFKTLEEFEIYAKQNFYLSSRVGYKQFDILQEVYTYSVILTNEETGEQMNKTFIVQLGEGTEFVLSFNI